MHHHNVVSQPTKLFNITISHGVQPRLSDINNGRNNGIVG